MFENTFSLHDAPCHHLGSCRCSHRNATLRETNPGPGVPCGSGDYVFLISMFVLLLVAMTAAYFTYTKQCENAVKSQSFIIISCGLGQLAISLQVISVINNFHLEWGEPIKSIIAATEVLAFELNIMSFDCITPSEAVMLFLFHAMILPFLLLLLCVIHCLIVLVKRERTLKLHRLGHVTGAFFSIFFISLCSSLMPPFLCYTHPNNVTTVRAFLSVYCTGTGQHAMMLLVSGLAYLLPVLFLATALWLLVQLPRKLQAGDMLFIHASSFLYQRFRPGAENFSLWLLLRNALLVLLPLGSTSASTFMMNILLSASLMVSAFVKPWRMMACNYLDMFLIDLLDDFCGHPRLPCGRRSECKLDHSGLLDNLHSHVPCDRRFHGIWGFQVV